MVVCWEKFGGIWWSVELAIPGEVVMGSVSEMEELEGGFRVVLDAE